MTLSVAIVGSGPAACYAAERLARDASVSIDVIERLPVPFGLVRHGVAADHQGTKAVARIFDRIFARPQVAFSGDVELGAAVSLDELRRIYDAVVIATGAAAERRLAVPGAALDGALGSRDLVFWFNAHPEHDAAAPLARARVAVLIGNGNVALDVARVLAKSPAELAAADLSPD